MTTHIDMGAAAGAARAELDLEELLASRLLVQGNSGSGKSHLLRRLLEQSAGYVQQVVIDPEGDFVTLAKEFGHLVIEAADYTENETASIAARVRQHRISVILNLEGLEVDAQLRCAGAFLNRLFDAPRDQWFPALVVVDEAQLFAPAAAGDVGEEARRVSLAR
jgi:DNA helicase HerA-like ATPase